MIDNKGLNMDSSRQLLLGTGVFIGGGILLMSLVKQMDAPQETTQNNTPQVEQVATDTKSQQKPLTADLETEERILAQKRQEREKKLAELDQKTRKFLTEQEKAEALAMQKARLENEQYRSAAEPVVDEPPEEQQTTTPVPVTRPVVTAREPVKTTSSESQSREGQTAKAKTEPKPKAESVAATAPSSPQQHIAKKGDGLIKLARQYNVPVEALSQANKLPKNASIRVGQKITIPSSSQVDRLVREYKASNSNASNSSQSSTQQTKPAANPAPSSSAPTRQLDYQVKRGDGLIKLARQYNVPVEALAEANNMSTNSSLRVGQSITIPSRKQVARLQREAEQKKAAEQNKREAQQRLAEARRKAASGEAKGTFGVQVALADNQQKADEIVKKLRAAGYPASTSKTSKGVRVIVGPEKGKEAALALKDKINSDSRTGVNNAWVLYWR